MITCDCDILSFSLNIHSTEVTKELSVFLLQFTKFATLQKFLRLPVYWYKCMLHVCTLAKGAYTLLHIQYYYSMPNERKKKHGFFRKKAKKGENMKTFVSLPSLYRPNVTFPANTG